MVTLQDLLFSRPALANISVPTLQRWLEWLLALLAELPPPVLTSAERMNQGGYAFFEGTLLCREVEQALTGDPSLFPGLGDLVTRWIDLGRRANLWLCLRDALQAAAASAEDQYLLSRGEHLRTALAIVRAGSGAEEPLVGLLDPLAAQRHERLAPARWVVRAWQDRIRRRRRR